MHRYLLITLGVVFLLLGIVGVILPVLPTTPFILLTAACWAQASPRFHAWLLSHPFFGGIVKNWQTNRAIPKQAKLIAIIMMALSCLFLFYKLDSSLYWLAICCSLVCTMVTIWMWRLPNA